MASCEAEHADSILSHDGFSIKSKLLGILCWHFFGSTLSAINHWIFRFGIRFHGGHGRMSLGPFIYYVSTFCFIISNIFTNFWSIFLSICVLKISNYSMKILSKCNVEIEILVFWQKKKPVFVKSFGVKLSFVL